MNRLLKRAKATDGPEPWTDPTTAAQFVRDYFHEPAATFAMRWYGRGPLPPPVSRHHVVAAAQDLLAYLGGGDE